MKCGAKTRQGTPCKNKPVPGMKRCRLHGGMTPVGKDSPHWKTGRYSKHLPQNLLERYRESASDPDLLAMRDEIALLDARITELLGQLNSGGGIEDWSNIRDTWEMFLELQDRAATAGIEQRELDRIQRSMGETIRNMTRIIRMGHRNISLWHEIQRVMEDRRRIVTTESKRLSDMHQMITAEQATGMVLRLIDVVKTRVTDKEILGQIASDLRRVINYTAD